MDTLYISDLDGTLVNDKAELSEYTLSNLNSLIAQGLPFTVASARSIVSMQQMLRGLKLRLPVISFNGAYLSDFESGEHEIVKAIDPAIAHAIFQCLPGHGCIPFLSTYTGVEERVYYEAVNNDGMDWYYRDRIARKDPRFRRIDSFQMGLNEQAMCLTFIDKREKLLGLENELLDKFGEFIELHLFENQYSPGWHWLTVHDRRASKDQAITSLKELCGLEASQIVVFGDNTNDVKMFRAAEYAIAVENAASEAKAQANEIIGSNLEDSVVKYLLENWPHRKQQSR